MDGGRPVGTPGGEERLAAAVEPVFRSGTEPAFRSGTEPLRLRGYAWSVFAIATVAVVAVAVSSAPLPGSGLASAFSPVVALGVLIALSLNQLAFFPSEWSATSEAAVLVAAVVGFTGDQNGAASGHGGGVQLLGPAAVAFLCGPLDLVHLRQRAFWRMAYNSGNRMIAALVAAAVYHEVSDAVVQPGLRFVFAALAASLVFAFVDLVVFVGFEQLRGQPSLRAAVREDLLVDCLTVPLGLLGAAAGLVAVEAGWWVGALVLVPAAFVPELVLVRARRALRRSASAARALRATVPTVLSGAAVVAVVVAVEPLPSPTVLGALVVVAVLAGLEVHVDVRAPIPGPGLVAVVVAAIVVGGHAAAAAGVFVAVTATATAWLLVRRNAWWVPPVAAAAALVSVAVFDTRPSRVGALAAALAFELVLVTRVPRILWTAPLVCTAVALSVAWHEIGAADAPFVQALGVAVLGAALVAVAAGAALWGALPWASRVLGPWSARSPRRGRRLVVVATATLSLGLGIAAAATVPNHRGLLVAGASAVAGAVATMVMIGVRQWRFAPHGRAFDAALVLASVLSVSVVYPAAALDGSPWSVVVLVAALGVCVTIGWPLALRADAAARFLDAPRPAP